MMSTGADCVPTRDLADWLAVRGRQLAAGELVYIAHQLDFVGRSPAARCRVGTQSAPV